MKFYNADGANLGGDNAQNNDRLSYLEKEFKNVIAQRDEAKKRIETIEAEKQAKIESELKEKEQYKQLLELKEKELSDAKDKANKLTEYEQKVAQIEEERRQELIVQLPDSFKANFADADLETLKKLVSTLPEVQKLASSDGKTGKRITDTNKTWKELTNEEKEALRNNNPSKYQQLLKDFTNRR
jgi:hypothetical protein